MCQPVRIGWAPIVFAILHAAAHVANAQPWVPPPGEGTVSVTYQNYYVKGHFVGPTGVRTVNGATHSKSLTAEFDVGLPNSIGLTVSLPYIRSKYTGPDVYYVAGIPTYPGPLDDGLYHGAFQDLHVEGRRMFEFGRFAVAPLAGLTLPTHEYETQGEAVPGRHRTEVQFGASAGTDLGNWLPSGYLEARYALGAAERIDGIPAVHSNIDLEAGCAVTHRLDVRGLSSWQIRNKYPTVAELVAHGWVSHDRFIVSNYFNLGGGLNIRLTRSIELSATWVATLTGSSGAHIARVLAIGLTRDFGGGLNGLGGSTTVTK